LVIDPLAANQLGYWRWSRSGAYYGIPPQNFIGWFVVSLMIFSLFSRKRPKIPHEMCKWQKNRAARHVGLSIVIFFTANALSDGLVLAGSIGLGLCLFHLELDRPLRTVGNPSQFSRRSDG